MKLPKAANFLHSCEALQGPYTSSHCEWRTANSLQYAIASQLYNLHSSSSHDKYPDASDANQLQWVLLETHRIPIPSHWNHIQLASNWRPTGKTPAFATQKATRFRTSLGLGLELKKGGGSPSSPVPHPSQNSHLNSHLSLYLYSKEVVAPKSFMMQKTHNAALLSGPNLQHTSCETGQVCQQHSRTRAGFILGFRRVWQFQLCHELLQAEPCVVKCQDGYDVWLCKYD